MSVRFRIHENTRQATVAGVHYQDLRSIFSAAAINYYDDLAKLRRKKRLSAQERENLAWVEGQLQIIKTIEGAISDAIAATHPPPRPPTKADRLRAVQEARKERLLLDSILDQIIARRKDSK